MVSDNMRDYALEIAENALDIGAIKLSPGTPFEWASGYKMPIYNDNRMFLSRPIMRDAVIDGLIDLIYKQELEYDVIAGTSTAGIPPGAILADRLRAPFIYIRDKPKGHGLMNQIEGIDAESDLEGRKTIVIEDLISTGGSSARAVQAVRDANGQVDYCLSVFNYGLETAVEQFESMEPPCKVHSLLTYDILLDVAKGTGYINDDQIELLKEWREDPFNWGENHGCPRVEK